MKSKLAMGGLIVGATWAAHRQLRRYTPLGGRYANSPTKILIVGGGFEYAFTKHFVGRGEYLYADYGSVTLTKDRTRTEFRNEMHLVRVGASYRF